jgi:hypothetical protein
MMHDIWKLFPRLVEQKINALLDNAEPNRFKAYQLYKACQNESLWSENFEKFNNCLFDFFNLPKQDRSKSKFDYFLNRPMHRTVFNQFTLDFRNAHVSHEKVLNLSSWAHNIMRINLKTNSVVISTEVMTRTVICITKPNHFEKASEIEFEDFCSAWKRTVFKLFGKRYDFELAKILNEIRLLNIEQKNIESTPRFVPLIYLTQTEIDWTQNLQKAAKNYDTLPKFPLSRGPQKSRLIEIEKVVQLYSLVMNSDKPELICHRQSVRDTLIDRCETLIRERAK